MTATSEITEAAAAVANLQVATFPGVDDERAASLREVINPPARSVGIDQIGQVLEEAQDAGIAILYSRPERSLLLAMAEGRSPSEAMNAWQQAAERSLLAWRRNRKRVVLAPDAAVLQEPSAFVESLRARLGVQLGFKGEAPCPESSQPFEALHRLIAAQMVVQSSGVQDLIAELEAASVLAANNDLPPVDCEAVFQDMTGKRVVLEEEHETLQARCKDQEEEKELLLLQLHQVQEELEGYAKQAQAQSDKLHASERALQEANDETAALATRYKDQEEENELLLLQLHQVQEELEHYFAQVQEKTNKVVTLESELETMKSKKIAARNAANRNERALNAQRKDNKKLEAEFRTARLTITAMNRSTSWRLTKPLRFIGRLFKRSKPAVSQS